MAERKRIKGFTKRLKTISTNEPAMVAPTIPAIPNRLPTLIAGLAKVKSVPIIPETREPTWANTFRLQNSCNPSNKD